MMETRQDHAACDFEAKIVVSGGLQLAEDLNIFLITTMITLIEH